MIEIDYHNSLHMSIGVLKENISDNFFNPQVLPDSTIIASFFFLGKCNYDVRQFGQTLEHLFSVLVEMPNSSPWVAQM